VHNKLPKRNLVHTCSVTSSFMHACFWCLCTKKSGFCCLWHLKDLII